MKKGIIKRIAPFLMVIVPAATLGAVIGFGAKQSKIITSFENTDAYKIEIQNEIDAINEEFSRYNFTINDKVLFDQKTKEYDEKIENLTSTKHALELLRAENPKLEASYNKAFNGSLASITLLFTEVVGFAIGGLCYTLKKHSNSENENGEEHTKRSETRTLKPTPEQLKTTDKLDRDINNNPPENIIEHR